MDTKQTKRPAAAQPQRRTKKNCPCSYREEIYPDSRKRSKNK